jgi:carboxypeptidase C (cathepsin A)
MNASGDLYEGPPSAVGNRTQDGILPHLNSFEVRLEERCIVISSLLLCFLAQQARAQAPPPAPAVAPAQAPAPAPAKLIPAAGPGAVASGPVDETPVVTHHEINVNGQTLGYTATAAQMPIKAANGDNEAHMFYVAYTLDGVADSARRPLTFAFNGGPGSASIWVHMGAMGPREPQLLDNGDMPPPPFKLIDNPNTWLDQTDLIFIDPVGTGYSRARNEEIARRMDSLQGDLQSVAEFIRLYMTRTDRWKSPVFIAGESYGTMRAAGLAGRLIDEGIALNGIVLMSTILNFATERPNLTNSLAYAVQLPTFAADAFYHKKLPAELQRDLNTTLKEVENWAMTGYIQALDKGSRISAAERKAAIDKLARYTGLDPRYIDGSDLRIDVQHFQRELLRDQRLIIGRLDGRLTGPAPLTEAERAEYDPSNTLPEPAFRAAFLQYVRGELGYKSDMMYYISGGIMPWNWNSDNNYAQTGSLLYDAFAKNPYMKLLVCAGYFDLATPYFAAEYNLDHIGLHPDMLKRVSWQFYRAGHMMYIEKDSAGKLKHDVGEFLHSAMPHE